jgi:hypothetical protein
MVAIIGACLRAVASDQERVISGIAHGNAVGIATTVAEVERLGAAVAGVKAALVGGNDTVQVRGGFVKAAGWLLGCRVAGVENVQ